MGLVAGDERAEMRPKLVVLTGADMVEFIDRDQAIVESLHAEFIDGKPEGRMGTDHYVIGAGQKLANRLDLGFGDADLVGAGGVAEIPARRDLPIRPEAEFRQRFVGETAADGAFRHDDDRLLDPLIVQLVEGDEHQAPGSCPRPAAI